MGWRHTVFANVGQCFQWGAQRVVLAGIKGGIANAYTAQEFPSLLEDLQDGFRRGTPPLNKGSYELIEDKRIMFSSFQHLLSEAKGDDYVILASVPNQYFLQVQEEAGTNKNVIICYGE